MDHAEVVRLQAAEKYVLGELPVELRDEFEEHYFDCTECSDDVKHLVTLIAVSRSVLKEPQALPAKRSGTTGWFAWLRPSIAVPAMAALAAIVLFQNVVTIPSLQRHSPADGAPAVFSSVYHLQGATRGEDHSQITVGAKESFALDFDFTPAVTYASYAGKIEDGKGASVLTFPIKGEMANREMHVVVPGGTLRPGEYALVLSGEASASGGSGAQEVQRIPFSLLYRP